MSLGQQVLLLALLAVFLFCEDALPITLILAIWSLILGVRGSGIIGLLGVALSVLVLFGCVGFLTPLYNILQ